MPLASKNNRSNFFGSRLFLIGGVIVLLFLGVAYSRAYYQNYLIGREIQRLQIEAERLRAKKFETLELLRYAKSPAYVEEKARVELNLVKDGEKVAVVGKSVPSSGQPGADVVTSAYPANFVLWWRYFFGHK